MTLDIILTYLRNIHAPSFIILQTLIGDVSVYNTWHGQWYIIISLASNWGLRLKRKMADEQRSFTVLVKFCWCLHKMPPIELPRLTGSLRAFSGLSSPHSRPPENGDDLKRKRELRSKKQLEKILSWSELKGLILDATSFDKNATHEVGK